jgi:protein required for attachment to host cells
MEREGRERPAWIALVDAERCRLLRCDRTKAGTLRVEELTALENQWPKHRRGRPMALGGMTGGSYAAPHHYAAERVRRFAEDVSKLLAAECGQRRVDRLTIIAPARVLGELRKRSTSRDGSWELREGELMQFSTAALAGHPVIERLIDMQGAESHDRKPSQTRHRLRP